MSTFLNQPKASAAFLLFLLAPVVAPASAQSLCEQLQAMDYRCDGSSFKTAVMDGDADAVRLFLQSGQSPNQTLEVAGVVYPAIAMAVNEGYVDIARALADAGADISSVMQAGDAQVGSTVKNAIGNPEMLRFVLSAGADASPPTPGGFFPIHTCLIGEEAPHLESLRVLLDHGIDPNSTGHGDVDWVTPLVMAALMGHDEAISILVGYGADPTVQAPDGTGLPEMAEIRSNYDTANALREAIEAYE